MDICLPRDNIVSGLKQEWLLDGHVVAYTLESAKLAAITSWSELAVAALESWPADRPYLAMHDVSQPGIGLLYFTAVEYDVFNVGVTPGARTRVQDAIAARPDWKLAVALVVSPSLSGRMAKFQLSSKGPSETQVQTKMFFYRSAALKWLGEINNIG